MTEADFTASALVENFEAWTADARLQELLNLGDKRLKALASLTKEYKTRVDERTKVGAKRESILSDR